MDKLKTYVTRRVVAGTLLAVAILWLFSTIMGILNTPPAHTPMMEDSHVASSSPAPHSGTTFSSSADSPPAVTPDRATGKTLSTTDQPSHAPDKTHSVSEALVPKQVETPSPGTHGPTAVTEKPASVHLSSAGHEAASNQKRIPGVAFVDAAQKPLRYELDERFWGWRPNDILNVTDNVNNFQLGVLEVTRRTAVILAERLSRTGSVESYDKNLEHAMDWFMTKPDRYWFPSPENRYRDALNDWGIYMEKLKRGEASFYTRADNLLPLLAAYASLLGSCDENLVKEKEASGETVSWFRVDDYFYYAKGIASALHTILEAVLEDFHTALANRNGTELLHHAIESCHRASHIQPWVVTDADLSGILANHRANMAAPISHARFYLDVLIATLST